MYEIYRISNDTNFKLHYKKYCKILSSVILTAQKMHFDKRLLKSTNRQKTTWNIVKNITNKGNSTNNIQSMIINPYPTAFPYGNGMVLHFYQQQESSTTKTVHRVINKGLKAYV